MNNKFLLVAARAVSLLFSPFYFPTAAFAVLIYFSYLNLLPLQQKLLILAMVYIFTVALPQFSIYLYRYINGWARHQLGNRERRIIPYILSITSYGCLLYMIKANHMPGYMMGIIVTALAIQIVCSILTPLIKPSTHAAAAGGVIGCILAFSLIFRFDPTLWLCIAILLTGAVASSRIILRFHNLTQVTLSIIIGIACGFLCILMV